MNPSLSSRLCTSRIFSGLTLGKRCLCSHPTLDSTTSPHPCCRSQGKINDQSAGDVTPSPHRPSSIHPLWLELTECVIQCLKQGLSWMGCDLNHTINTISLHLQSNGFIFYSKYIIILFHYLLSAIIKMYILLFCFVLSRQPEDRQKDTAACILAVGEPFLSPAAYTATLFFFLK